MEEVLTDQLRVVYNGGCRAKDASFIYLIFLYVPIYVRTFVRTYEYVPTYLPTYYKFLYRISAFCTSMFV